MTLRVFYLLQVLGFSLVVWFVQHNMLWGFGLTAGGMFGLTVGVFERGYMRKWFPEDYE